MERDQEAERRQEAEQKVPHGLPEHPLSPPARRVYLAGRGQAEGPLVYQRGLSPKQQQQHYAFCGAAPRPRSLRSRPAPAARRRAP